MAVREWFKMCFSVYVVMTDNSDCNIVNTVRAFVVRNHVHLKLDVIYYFS